MCRLAGFPFGLAPHCGVCFVARFANSSLLAASRFAHPSALRGQRAGVLMDGTPWPDMYLFQPGSAAYVDAANGFLGDQLLFGSSYPFRPIGQSIEDALALGLRESVIDRVLYGNAARLLGLGGA